MPLPFSLRRCLIAFVLPVLALSAARAEESAPATAASEPKERNSIEVNGRFYPVYDFMTEVEPDHDPKPRLPRKAKKEGRGGTVLVGALVNRAGQVVETAVAMSNAEPDIEAAAKAAILRWTFPVQYVDDQPIDYAVMVPVRFDATPHFGPQ